MARAFTRYKEIQLSSGDDFDGFKKAKDDLNERLKKLTDDLDGILYMEQYKGFNLEEKEYRTWLATHQSFHWFAEFYEIIAGKSGFDVVIGNPPYVEYSKVRSTYTIVDYYTEKAANLYAFVIEKSIQIICKYGYTGMIIPLTSISNNSMKLLRDLLFKDSESFLSSYEIRPSELFDGVEQRLTIFLRNTIRIGTYSTGIRRWHAEQRNYLFETTAYATSFYNDRLLRLSANLESSIWTKYRQHTPISAFLSPSANKNSISYRTAGARYWIIFLNKRFKTESLSNKTAFFQNDYDSKIICATLNSNLFWWWYSINFDMFNIKDYMIFSFKFNYFNSDTLVQLSNSLENDLDVNKLHSVTNSKTRGVVSTFIYQKKLSKPIIDQIDCLLAQHYGFTHEELDFIINYDIKYRMGKELNSGEEKEE